MNLALLRPEDFIGPDTVTLRDRRAEHLLAILGSEHGDTVRVGILNGLIGTGSIMAISSSGVTMTVKCDQPPPPPLPVRLICAMQRPKTMRKILHCAASMGVKDITVLECWKVDKSYWSSPLLSQEELTEELILGLEQGRDTILPRVEFKRRFKPFVEDELPALLVGATGLVAHPGAAESCPTRVNGPIVAALGPEGGFTDYEVDKMAALGMRPVSLGERILRSEFAVAALLGRLF